MVTNALGHRTRMLYDSDGNMTRLTNALGCISQWTYDDNGRLYQSIAPSGLTISHGYDEIGRLTKVTNLGSGLVLNFAYDGLDRQTDTTFPDATTLHTEYSCCGVEWVRDRLNQTTYFEHDALGRVSQVTDPLSRVTSFMYNGANQVTHLITTVNGRERIKQFDYTAEDGFTRLTHVETPEGKTLDYDYTFRGQLSQRVDGNGVTVDFASDPLGRLATVTSNAQTMLTLNYNVLGLATNAVSTCSSFIYTNDPLNRSTGVLCQLSVPGFSTVQYKWRYQLDAEGNVTNRLLTGISGFTDTIETIYKWDEMNRLTNLSQKVNGSVNPDISHAKL